MRHFRVAWALVRFLGRAVPDRWHSRPPFLPVPSRKYLAWRLQTAYGGRRPPLNVVWRDIWQFGAWLAEFDEAELRGPSA